jgi:hypothetical protein
LVDFKSGMKKLFSNYINNQDVLNQKTIELTSVFLNGEIIIPSDFQSIVNLYERNVFKLIKELVYNPLYSDMQEPISVIQKNWNSLEVR